MQFLKHKVCWIFFSPSVISDCVPFRGNVGTPVWSKCRLPVHISSWLSTRKTRLSSTRIGFLWRGQRALAFWIIFRFGSPLCDSPALVNSACICLQRNGSDYYFGHCAVFQLARHVTAALTSSWVSSTRSSKSFRAEWPTWAYLRSGFR